MIKAMQYIRFDKCIDCNSERSIELYDIFDKPINYSYLLDVYEKNKSQDIISKFDNRNLAYMRCKKCGRVYCIDWRTKDIPIPLRAFWFIDTFLFNNYNR